jgi:hypothetical protein
VATTAQMATSTPHSYPSGPTGAPANHPGHT